MVPRVTLLGSDGAARPLDPSRSALTVVEFFSAHCPCQTAHDERLRELVGAYGPRGVAFLVVDSEVDATPDRDHEEAERHGYAFPILVDPHGNLARALRAEYATYTVVVDRAGRVVYVGGLDSDKNHLHGDATPFLREALDDALAGRPLRRAQAKTLGCALRLE
jgi:peroxiredoxin